MRLVFALVIIFELGVLTTYTQRICESIERQEALSWL